MFGREFKRDIRDHMARGNEIMVRGNEIMARSDATMARSNEVMAENRQAFEDLGHTLRQINLRNERVTNRMIAEIDDLIAESRAQRGALLALIDEMRGGGPAPAAG